MSVTDYPPEWRRLLELLASSEDGSTKAVLLTQGFSSASIEGLVAARRWE